MKNKKTKKGGIHYSRYIASWTKVYGNKFGDDFMDWLESIGVSEDEAMDIRFMAECGKMELEGSIAIFLHNRKSEKESA